MKRIKYVDSRRVNNINFIVHSIEILNYDGSWEEGGFDVICGDKTTSFIGWPTDSDLILWSSKVS